MTSEERELLRLTAHYVQYILRDMQQNCPSRSVRPVPRLSRSGEDSPPDTDRGGRGTPEPSKRHDDIEMGLTALKQAEHWFHNPPLQSQVKTWPTL